MKREDAEEFTQSLGQILGGTWRQIAWADRQGIPKVMGYENTRDWVKEELGGYVQLSMEDRREAVLELTEDGLSTREAAGVLGVGKSTVAEDLAVQNRTDANNEPAELLEPEGKAVQDRTDDEESPEGPDAAFRLGAQCLT